MRLLLAYILSIQFASADTRYKDTPFLPTIVAYENICSGVGLTPDIGKDNYTNICLIVTRSEMCKDVKESDLLDCDHLQASLDKHPWEFIKGCVRGGFKSIQDTLRLIWSAASLVYNYEETFDDIEVARLYLHSEYAKSGNLEFLARMGQQVLDQVETILREQYTHYGCLNHQAKSLLTCNYLADFIAPTEGLLQLLNGRKYLKDSKGISRLIVVIDPVKISKFSKTLAEYFAERTGKATLWMSENFEKYGRVVGRSKSEEAILDKLWRKTNEGKAKISTLEEAKQAITDGVGTRLILNSEKDVQAFVDDLAKKIKEGLNVTEISNYRPKGGNPYLNEAQIRQLKEAKPNLIIKDGDAAIRDSGYSSFHMNIDSGDGPIWEMQIRGRHVHEIAEIEHFFYDLKAGKGLSNRYVRSPNLNKSMFDYLLLTSEQRTKLLKYIEDRYVYARKVEEGFAGVSNPPAFPPGLPPTLSFENLKKYLVETTP